MFKKEAIYKEELDWNGRVWLKKEDNDIVWKRRVFFPKWRMIGLKGGPVFKRMVRGKRTGFWWNSSIKKDVKKQMKKGGVEQSKWNFFQ